MPRVRKISSGCVGHRGQRVAGEDRQRDPLRQQGLAEPVAAHGPADEQALDGVRHGSRARGAQCYGPRTAARRLGAAARTGCPRVGATSCTSSSWVAAGSGRRWRTASRRRGHTVAVIDRNPDAFRRLGPHFEGHDGHRRRVRPRHPARGGHRGRLRVRRGQQRRQLQHPGRPGRPGDVRRRQRGRAHLRPGPRRGLPAARHPHGRHRALDRRPDAPPAAPRRRRAGVARPERHRASSPRSQVHRGWVGHA